MTGRSRSYAPTSVARSWKGSSATAGSGCAAPRRTPGRSSCCTSWPRSSAPGGRSSRTSTRPDSSARSGAAPQHETYDAGRGWLMQGNEKVLETLADLLAAELSAASTYFIHSKMRDNWGYPDLAKRAYDDSMDEMRHAAKLIEGTTYL